MIEIERSTVVRLVHFEHWGRFVYRRVETLRCYEMLKASEGAELK